MWRTCDAKFLCWFSGMLWSFVTSLSLPNEDFGRMNKRWNPDCRSTFQGSEYSIWATNHWKVGRKSGFNLLFILPKSSFGEHIFNTSGTNAIARLARTLFNASRTPALDTLFNTDAAMVLSHTHLHAIITLWVGQTHRLSLSWTDTLSCYHHLAKLSWKDTSSMIRHAIIIAKLSWTDSEFDWHIDMLSTSACYLQLYPSKHFSREWVLDLGYEPLKSISKIWISSFVPSSKIFVWGA
jgi:hypothetical protein